MTARSKLLLNILAGAVSILPPAAATVSYFPIWKEEGAVPILSGLCLLLLLICAVPLFKLIATKFKTPSAPLVWLFIFVIFAALSSIAKEVAAIALIGFISNVLGALLYRIASRQNKKE